MLGKLIGLGIIVALAVLIFTFDFSFSTTPEVEALNVVGGEVVTRSETDADFTIIKGRGDIDTSVQVEASVVNQDLRGLEKNNGDSIAREASVDLQFLVNSYQTLDEIQKAHPCPSLEDWELAGGVSGGTEPNPPEYPLCDPDVLYDPARCSLYWDDLDPNIDHPVIVGEPRETQVFRPVIPTLTWDGATYTMRLADPSRNPDNYPDNC